MRKPIRSDLRISATQRYDCITFREKSQRTFFIKNGQRRIGLRQNPLQARTAFCILLSDNAEIGIKFAFLCSNAEIGIFVDKRRCRIRLTTMWRRWWNRISPIRRNVLMCPEKRGGLLLPGHGIHDGENRF